VVFEPNTYFESLTIMENIIVEARHESILLNKETPGQSGKNATVPLARSVSSVLTLFHCEVQGTA
jgi:hypothetical protein